MKTYFPLLCFRSLDSNLHLHLRPGILPLKSVNSIRNTDEPACERKKPGDKVVHAKIERELMNSQLHSVSHFHLVTFVL